MFNVQVNGKFCGICDSNTLETDLNMSLTLSIDQCNTPYRPMQMKADEFTCEAFIFMHACFRPVFNLFGRFVLYGKQADLKILNKSLVCSSPNRKKKNVHVMEQHSYAL